MGSDDNQTQDAEKKEIVGANSSTPVADTPNLLQQAEAIAARMEAANKETKELLERQEAIKAKELLAGRSEAGQVVPQLTDEDKKKQGMKEFFKGTTIEKMIK